MTAIKLTAFKFFPELNKSKRYNSSAADVLAALTIQERYKAQKALRSASNSVSNSTDMIAPVVGVGEGIETSTVADTLYVAEEDTEQKNKKEVVHAEVAPPATKVEG